MADQQPPDLDANGQPVGLSRPPDLDANGQPVQQGDLLLGNALGLAKGLGEGALSVVNPMTYVHAAQGAMALPGVIRSAAQNPGAAWQAIKDATGRINTGTTAEDVGRVLGAAATPFAIRGAIRSIPSAANAADNFQTVMGAAKDVPLDVSAPGDAALRVQELANRGGSMPKVVRDFLRRVTDPTQGDLTYGEARDFASNISRLSADETNRLTPVMKRQLGELRATLNQSIGGAAAQAGVGQQYGDAMSEYANAMKLRNLKDAAVTGAKHALPFAGAGALGYWLSKKAQELIP